MKFKKTIISIPVVMCLILGGCQSATLSNTSGDILASNESNATNLPLSDASVESKAESDDKELESKVTSSKASSKIEKQNNKSSIAQSEVTSSDAVASQPVSQEQSTLEASIYADDGYDELEIAKQLLKLVNQERRENQLEPLAQISELDKSALIRSEEMAQSGVLTHVRPDGKTWTTSFDESGYSDKYEHAYENIAFGNELLAIYNGEIDNYDIAKTLFDSWKQSESHYSAIINPKNTQTGIGVARVGNSIYSTEHFAEVDKNV